MSKSNQQFFIASLLACISQFWVICHFRLPNVELHSSSDTDTWTDTYAIHPEADSGTYTGTCASFASYHPPVQFSTCQQPPCDDKTSSCHQTCQTSIGRLGRELVNTRGEHQHRSVGTRQEVWSSLVAFSIKKICSS